jgi:hypothetical protein
MFIGELECLDNPKTLFDRPSNREIVNMGCPEDTLWVDEERSSEGDAFFFEVDAVGFGDGVRSVGVLYVSHVSDRNSTTFRRTMVNLRSGPSPPSFLFICDHAKWVWMVSKVSRRSERVIKDVQIRYQYSRL